MFLEVTETRRIHVPPADLGPALANRLEYLLREAVEGKRLPNIGLVVAVIDIKEGTTLSGKVLETGTVVFDMTYVAIVFRLVPEEVLDGRVIEVTSEALLVDVGAALVRVSRHHIPEHFAYDVNDATPRFISRDGTRTISESDNVRLRIMAETPQNDKFDAMGRIDAPFLGPTA